MGKAEGRGAAMSTAPTAWEARLGRLRRGALGVGVVALVICGAGAFFSPTQFFRAYLAAYLFYLGIGLGCFAVLAIYHLTGGAWGFLIRRVLEAGMRTLPLLAVMFMPIACGLGYLYPWARPAEVHADPGLQHKEVYLNEPFFWARAVLFFVLWIAVAYLLNAWSRRQDRTGDPALLPRLARLAGIGLVIYGISIHFASIDWLMSLQPAFRSTVFGPIMASGQLLSGMAFALIVLAWLVERPPVADQASVEALNDLGNLLFTFLIIWAYVVFFQFMLIWMANLQYDVRWYLPRIEGGWQWVAWALFLLHFVIPFFLLLLRDVKRDPRALAQVAGLLLFMQLVFMDYQILPDFPDTTLADHWMDFLAPPGLGGIWLAYFLWQLPRSPMLPAHDPNRAAAAHLHEHDLEEAAREERISHGG
jgi:hypothetical protein